MDERRIKHIKSNQFIQGPKVQTISARRIICWKGWKATENCEVLTSSSGVKTEDLVLPKDCANSPFCLKTGSAILGLFSIVIDNYAKFYTFYK